MLPRSESVVVAKRKEPTLEVTLVRKPPAVPILPTPTLAAPVISSEGLHASTEPPAQPVYESDKNMRAASKLPPTGNLPLPSQEGKERRLPEFQTKPYALGKVNEPGGRPSKPAATSEPAWRQEALPLPAVKPHAQQDNVRATQAATPSIQSSHQNANAQQSASKDLPAVTPPSERAGYQPQTERTRIQGSVSNRGRSAVDAISTPLGRYRKAVADAIGSRWYYYVNQRIDLITVGAVHIKFFIDREGKVQNLRILSNSSNETFANYCVQSVTEAKVPGIPPDLVSKLEDGRLEIQYTFTIYPQ